MFDVRKYWINYKNIGLIFVGVLFFLWMWLIFIKEKIYGKLESFYILVVWINKLIKGYKFILMRV